MLHTDHLGTPRVGSNASGASVWSWSAAHNAFGGTTAPTGSKTINLRHAGQYFDAESGLFYNWNRYYNPQTGRYISSDPIGLDGGLNTYAYAGANPVMFVDPRGTFQEMSPEQIEQLIQASRAARRTATAAAIADGLTPDPSDVFLHKWLAEAGIIVSAVVVEQILEALNDESENKNDCKCSIFRVVDSQELSEILGTQQFSFMAGGLEQKQFWRTFPQAKKFKNNHINQDGGQRSIVGAVISCSTLRMAYQVNEPTIGVFLSFSAPALIQVNADVIQNGGIQVFD